MGNKITIKNKKASFNYEFLETYTAGIVLEGTEIKSIRLGKVSLVDSFCLIRNNQVIMKNSLINKFEVSGVYNHEEKRDRVLLLNKQEIRHLKKKLEVQGITLIPIKLYINEKNLCKVDIALCKGKKEYDKRESIKEQDNKRELDRIIKSYK
jgi:SsrA-binding protein